MDLASRETHCITKFPGYNTVLAWMPDDKALLLARYTSNANIDLFYLAKRQWLTVMSWLWE